MKSYNFKLNICERTTLAVFLLITISFTITNMNANEIYNCVEEQCHNDVDKNINLYICNAPAPYKKSLSLPAQLLACYSADQRSLSVKYPKCSIRETLNVMGKYEKHSAQSFRRVWHVQSTIFVMLLAVTFTRVLIRWIIDDDKCDKFKIWFRYILEITVIVVPFIVTVNVANRYVELIVLLAFLILVFVMWRTNCWELAAKRDYEFGRRPALFTLMRSSINIVTAVCILAIDFNSFPKEFRKTRRYGVGLMDVGIGMFVFSMGLVASVPRKLSDWRKLLFTVCCLLVLGLSRTIVIAVIDYHQDEHEYGTHLNAFFTLGLTKLFAAFSAFPTKTNNQLLALGLVILFLHEAILQCGVLQYVMDPETKRNNFINSNREGLCSLPGFVALHHLSEYLGKWLQEKDELNFEEIKNKLKTLSLTSSILWLLVTLAIFVIGIARVTCNLGYVLWIFATAVTILTFYLVVFDIVLDTLVPANRPFLSKSNNLNSKIPVVIEAVNFNGLTFFLLANVLTGCTNIFFDTDEKTTTESVVILYIYMLITTTFICTLHCFNIRIA